MDLMIGVLTLWVMVKGLTTMRWLFRERIFLYYRGSVQTRLGDEDLPPATKTRPRLDPPRLEPKRFIFPHGCYIKSPVNPVITKAIRTVALAAAYFVAGKLGLMLAHL